MPHAIIDLEARGLLSLETLPFCTSPMKIIVVDRAGREFNARIIHEEVCIAVAQNKRPSGGLIGWKMRA